MNLQETLTAFLVLARDAGCARLCVAYSGGIDSHVLLELLNKTNQLQNHIPIDAIYINHNLQDASHRWGKHCQKICQSLNVPFKQINVNATPTTGESPEEKARLVRYHALAKQLQANHWLVTAQHRDDQAETLLLQLLRGSGVNGLAAMPESRVLGNGMHQRPLLRVTKQQIINYANEQNLSWIDDPTNQEQTIPRNYLRNTVIPSLIKGWPETTKMLSRSAEWLSESAEIMEEIAEQDFIKCCAEHHSLIIDELKKLSLARQKNLLRFWFHRSQLKRPGIEKLELIMKEIINAREDASPQLNWQGISIRRFKEQLFMLPEWPEVTSEWQVNWDGINAVALVDKIGTLSSKTVLGSGLNNTVHNNLQLRLRKGGEHCHPVGRSRSRSLKKLFQEYSVPPWLRERWPLLYRENQLIAVPGLFICKGFEAKKSENGLEFFVDF